MALPRYTVLQSTYSNNTNYLQYMKQVGDVPKIFQFSGLEVIIPTAKLELEMAASDPKLVNIRSCYNNKYLVVPSDSARWIAAVSNEPNEDQSKLACTLFKPVYVDQDAKLIRFLHVSLGKYVSLWTTADTYANCLYVSSSSPSQDSSDMFTIIDWESLVILPKHICFKNADGKYLHEAYTMLQFSATDKGDPTVAHQIFTNADGTIRIMYDSDDQYWVCSSETEWIFPGSDYVADNDPNSFFKPIMIDSNVVALQNKGNNKFCCRYTKDSYLTDMLIAGISSISNDAHLVLEELVMSRKVYNVNFRLEDSRVYNETILDMAKADSSNASDQPNTVQLTLKYSQTTTNTWNSSVSLKLGVEFDLKAGIPFIADEKITISGEVEGKHEWGNSTETSKDLEDTYTVTVPPNTRVIVTLLSTMGTCDVPFSYTQRDVLINGSEVLTNKEDGLFTGINCYNFYHDVRQEPLS